MERLVVFLLVCLAGQVVIACPAPSLGGCKIFPDGDEWNRPIDQDPVDYFSSCWVAAQLAGNAVHLDLGVTEKQYGIPYNLVKNSDPNAVISYGVGGDNFSDQSDPGPVRCPFQSVLIEGGTTANPNPSSGDRHVLLLNTDTCTLFETYKTVRTSDGLRCASSAEFDLSRDNAGQRPDGWTSADAAGLPILPGLLKFAEANSGEITHALRFTLPSAPAAYVHPATHFGPNEDTAFPPYGTRFRLKASFDESPYTGAALAVVRAFKKYGLIFADQGSSMYVSGVTDPGWETVLDQIHGSNPIDGRNFEAVQTPSYFPVVRDWTPSVADLTCAGKSSNSASFNPTYVGNCQWSTSATGTTTVQSTSSGQTTTGQSSTSSGQTTTGQSSTTTTRSTTTTTTRSTTTRSSTSGGSGGGCFAASALVRVLESDAVVVKPLSDVRSGDLVESFDDDFAPLFTPVLFVAHRDDARPTALIELFFDSASIKLTPGHLLYAATSLKQPLALTAAAAVRVGDFVQTAGVGRARVVDIGAAAEPVRNPLTANDRIVVSGVAASVFVGDAQLYAAATSPLKLLGDYAPSLLHSAWFQRLLDACVWLSDLVEGQLLVHQSVVSP